MRAVWRQIGWVSKSKQMIDRDASRESNAERVTRAQARVRRG
jgi:hypothetical protein